MDRGRILMLHGIRQLQFLDIKIKMEAGKMAQWLGALTGSFRGPEFNSQLTIVYNSSFRGPKLPMAKY